MVKFFNHRESQRSNLEESIVRTQCFEKSQRAIQGHLLWKPVRFCDSEAHGGSSASPMNISPWKAYAYKQCSSNQSGKEAIKAS